FAIMYLAILMLVGPSSPVVRADDTVISRESLKGIQTVSVVIEDLDEDAKKVGLTEDNIRTDVELKLRLAGLNIAGQNSTVPGNTYLYVNVKVLPPFAANVTVELNQSVLLQRNGDLVIGSTTWELSGGLTNPTSERIRNLVKALADRFLNAWL